MPWDVGSDFFAKTQATHEEPRRSMTIGGSDFSHLVTRWPAWNVRYDRVLPVRPTVELANGDGDLNFYRTNKSALKSTVQLHMGYDVGSVTQYLTLFEGSTVDARFHDGRCTVTLEDKSKVLGEKLLGSNEAPYEYFANSGWLPSSIAWAIVTSGEGNPGLAGAGFSNVTSSNNPDIDFESFQAWSNVFSLDTVLISARFEGQTCAELLAKIARATDSAIFMVGEKLHFHRFTTIEEPTVATLGLAEGRTEMTIADMVVNRQYVHGAYDAASRTWSITVLSVASTSVDSFGDREAVERDETVWYADSVSALNFAQRKTSYHSQPKEEFEVDGTLVPMTLIVGDAVRIHDPSLGVSSSETWRVLEVEIDMDDGRSRLYANGYQMLQPFVLDDPTNGLLDQDYNYLL